jgi:2-polyprenyl-6-methoxyphenol hydroxylase-like FAD-dependent oxidoreductase
MTFPLIVVVGGGPGGLLLARLLQRHDLAVTVLEQEDSASSRAQGRSLDLHAGLGQEAMKAAGLYDAWAALARYEDQASRRLDTQGRVLADMPTHPDDTANPEIDRGQLRGLLLDALAPGTVRWGTRLTALTRRPDGRHDLAVSGPDGPEVLTADLVVGADGAWSQVRPLLSDARPAYCGMTFVELVHTDLDTRRPELGALVGRGTAVVFDADRGLFAQRLSGGNLTVYVALRVAEDWVDTCRDGAGFPHDDPAAARALLLDLLPGWSPILRDLVAHGDDDIAPRRLYALPVGHSWPTDPGVTLLGDAAHLMSPFGGQGANLALVDAADLAAAVVAALADGDLGRATARYEAVMHPRAARSARGAAHGIATIGIEDDLVDPIEAFAAASAATE